MKDRAKDTDGPICRAGIGRQTQRGLAVAVGTGREWGGLREEHCRAHCRVFITGLAGHCLRAQGAQPGAL